MTIHADHNDGTPPGTETGERPILVSPDADCATCGKRHEMEVCPRCHADIMIGYGLAFGGFGEYKCCENGCGWFWKRQDPEE